MVGPFDQEPFEKIHYSPLMARDKPDDDQEPFEKIHYSPLMARDKPDGGVCVMVDLSWPLFNSVNSGILDNQFDIMSFNLKYPTIHMVIEKVQEIGSEALLYKVDLECAFRNLRIDPAAYPLCCLKWNDVTYVDVMARDKPDGGVCVMVDLSWPLFNSVNSGILDNQFDIMSFNLKYPTIHMVIEKVQEIGSEALLYKVDLECAFRNLRIDPAAYPLCCLKWNDVTYVDVSVAFGLKIGAAACQMCTDVITYKLRQQGAWVMNYLDDYIGVADKHKAESQF